MAINKKTGKSYESSMKATTAWKKKHVRQIKVEFNYETDKAIIEKLNSVPNKTEYLRQLILADLANGGK